MKQKTDCFIACQSLDDVMPAVEQLRRSRVVRHIFLLVNDELAARIETPQDCTLLVTQNLTSSAFVALLAERAVATYALLCLKPYALQLGESALERMMLVAGDTEAAMLYSDRYTMEQGVRKQHPVIDYQEGALRDDFDFGSVWLVRTDLLQQYAALDHEHDYQYAGMYDLRLFLSREGHLFHLNEYLYTEEERDLRASGEKQFDYVNPRNREVQIEMEQACTDHLRMVNALVDTSLCHDVDFAEQEFDVEASVIIPDSNTMSSSSITTRRMALQRFCQVSCHLMVIHFMLLYQNAQTSVLEAVGMRRYRVLSADVSLCSWIVTTCIHRPRHYKLLLMHSMSKRLLW